MATEQPLDTEGAEPVAPPTPKPRTRKKTTRDPFEIKLSPEKEAELVAFLIREIDYAEQARNRIVGDNEALDAAHLMYEGGDVNLTKNTPWVGASNLGSFIVTEKVASMRSRIVATLFADPVWIVEGLGEAATRAPLVEIFSQWKSEQSRLQTFMTRVAHNSLVEGTGVLEVCDRVVMRKGLRTIHAVLQRDATTGETMLDPSGDVIPVRTADEKYVEAEEGEPYLRMVISDAVRATAGPSFRVLSLKDFFLLPGHANEREDIWGYAKRVFRRLPDLQSRVREGFYKNVDQLGLATDREQTPQADRQGIDIAPGYDATAEKEIWEATFLADLNNDGYEEWYVATVSRIHRTLLRVQYQDYGTPHYLLFTPLPRPNSVYGYSYAYDVLGSLYDEHAALRNMFADRSVMAVSAPWMVTEGSAWNPQTHPFGPRQRIPVRDMDEIKQLEVRDVPSSVIEALRMVLQAAERLSGQNDTTTGVLTQQDRTLGEVQLSTQQSFVRIDEVVKNFQEGMEDLFDLQLLIWRNKLENEPEALPGELLQIMSERNINVPDGTITADMLRGVFRGKPHDSVENADYSRMRVDFSGMLTALNQLAMTVPALAQHLNTPPVVRSILSQLARIYRWPDRANLVGTFTGEAAPPPMPPGLPGAPLAGAPSGVTPPTNALSRLPFRRPA
jgi:hypothetical protein